MRKENGFTLLEVIVVLAILGVLTVMGVPSMKSFIDDAKVNSAASEFVTDAIVARSTAIKLGCDVTMAPKSSSWQNGWTVTYKALSSTTAQCDPTGVSTVVVTVKDHEPLSGITVAGTTASFSLGFDARVNESTLPAIRLYPSSNPRVNMRCVGLNATGKPSLKVDVDFDRAAC